MFGKSLLTVLLVTATPLAFGAGATHPADGKTKLAIELMEISHYDQNMKAMQGQIAAMMEQQFASSAKCDAAQPTIREFSKAMTDKTSAVLFSDDLKVDIASVYAEVFSEDELRDVIAFYKSPLGKKLLDRMPELMQKSMQISQQRMQSVMPELEKLGEDYGPRIREASESCKTDAAPAAKPAEGK